MLFATHVTQNSFAQLTVKGGINFASISANATEANYSSYQNTAVVGYQLGIAYPFNISPNLAIQPEAYWMQKGGKSQYVLNNSNGLVSTITYNYGEVPILLKLSLGETTGSGFGVYILAGPAVGIAFNGTYQDQLTVAGATATTERDVSFNVNDQNYQNRVEWSGIIGIGATMSRVVVDVRYNLGFTNLINTGASSSAVSGSYQRNRGIGVTVGYQF